MRDDMKGVRAFLTLKIKILRLLQQSLKAGMGKEEVSKAYHEPFCSMACKKGKMPFFSLRNCPRLLSLDTPVNPFIHEQDSGRQGSQDQLQIHSLFGLHSCHVNSHAVSSLKWSWSVQQGLAPELSSNENNFMPHSSSCS